MRRATQYVGSMHEMYRRRVAIAFGLPEDTGTEVLARRVDEERLVPASTWSSLPEPAAGQVQAFSSSPRSWANAREETAAMPAMFRQAQGLTTLGSKPLVVLLGEVGAPRGERSDLDVRRDLRVRCGSRQAPTQTPGGPSWSTVMRR
jgi:hypothetical protein